MDYDPVSRQLFCYNSDLKQIGEIKHVARFTVDGRNNIIYYIHESTDTVYMLDMTNAAPKTWMWTLKTG